MPNFKVQLKYMFEPGHVNGSTEQPPPDILGDDGVVMPLAAWPAEPLDVKAADECAAVEQAQRLFAEAGRHPFVNLRVGEQRLLELAKRRRPGSPDNLTSVGETWLASPDGHVWHLVSLGTPRFE
jgi:hypothetical protein